MKQYKRAFVFGKYLPFHLGHKALIDFALSQCKFLYVVVCASDQENLDARIRAAWIEDTFKNQKNVCLITLLYNETELPNTSVSSANVSKIWAQKFTSILPKVDLVVTSEAYGDFVAQFMEIDHIAFDNARLHVPISATQIRDSVYDNWDFLPEVVKAYYQKKIVFLGTESTGKSSLSKELSQRFNSSLVEEVGREIIPDSNHFTKAQLRQITSEHANKIITACNELKPLVFIDTDIHITQSYAKYQLGQYLDIHEEIYAVNKADLYFYLTKDLNYTQDGTRLEEENRNVLDQHHRSCLRNFGISYVEVSGSWEERFNFCCDFIILDLYGK